MQATSLQYPMYSSPDLWLTDYLIAENLRLAYENQQAGNGGQAPPPFIQRASDRRYAFAEMKALIADEVRQQLAAEKAAAVQPTSIWSPAVRPRNRTTATAHDQRFFVVSSNLDITTAPRSGVFTDSGRHYPEKSSNRGG